MNYDPRLTILHADMDAFYAAVEVLDDPALRGQPLIVGHPGKRGVVSTASYEARKFGVHSAQPSAIAMRLCPNAVWRTPRMKRYAELSRQIRAIFQRFTPAVEPLSLDEAFLDVADSLLLFGGAVRIAEEIRRAVRAETGGLTVSVGVAENMFLAKVASDAKKPDGLTVIAAGTGAAYLAPLPVERLFGVGKRTAETLHKFGLRKIGDLAKLDETALQKLTGDALGTHLFYLARGLDDRAVMIERAAKSISSECTFEEDLRSDAEVERFFFEAADEVSEQLRAAGLLGRTVAIKVRTGEFETFTRARTLDAPTQLAGEIYEEAVRLYRTRIDTGEQGIRLLGVGVSALSSVEVPRQGMLFPRDPSQAETRVAAAIDLVRAAHGENSIQRARLIENTPSMRRRADPGESGKVRRRDLE